MAATATDPIRRKISGIEHELRRIEAQIDLREAAINLTRSSEWREFERNLQARLLRLGQIILFPDERGDTGDPYQLGFARGEAFALRSLLLAASTSAGDLPALHDKAKSLRERLARWHDVDGQDRFVVPSETPEDSQ